MLFRNILLAYCKAILHIFPKIMLYFLPQVEGEGSRDWGGGGGGRGGVHIILSWEGVQLGMK